MNVVDGSTINGRRKLFFLVFVLFVLLSKTIFFGMPPVGMVYVYTTMEARRQINDDDEWLVCCVVACIVHTVNIL